VIHKQVLAEFWGRYTIILHPRELLLGVKEMDSSD